MFGFIPSEPAKVETAVLQNPYHWCGEVEPDGDAHPFITAPPGSIYHYLDTTNDNVRSFKKYKNDARDDDWGHFSGLHCISETVAYSAFTDGGATTGTYNLGEQVPVGAWAFQTNLLNVTGFTGDTTATIQVGDGTDVDRYSTGTPSVFTTATAIDLGVPSGTKIHTTAKTVTITITSGSDWGLVTAGSLTIRLWYLL